MAILVTERWRGPSLSRGSGGYHAVRTFDVTGVSTTSEAITAVGLYDPATLYNATHPQSSLMYVDGQSCPPVPGFNVFQVDISYSTNSAGRHMDPGNPLSEPPQWHFEWGYSTEADERDAYGNAISNAGGFPFDTGVPTDVLVGTLVCTRNEPFYDAVTAVNFANAVNTQRVTFGLGWTFDKGQACSRRIAPVTPITNKSPYVAVQYSIEVRAGYKVDSDGFADGFKARIANVGRLGWWNDSGTKRHGPIAERLQDGITNVSTDVRLGKTGKPLLTSYIIATNQGTGSGYATPVDSPYTVPSTTVIEDTGDATFIKVFPNQIKLRDLNDLGLRT